MRRILALTILSLLSFAVHAQTTLVIRDVTVIDMTGRKPKARMTIAVTGNRISKIGRGLQAPKDATVVDGRGKFLIPGLWDMHVHALRPDRADYFFSLFIANGVTGIRDTGTTEAGFDLLAKTRREILSGERIGPRIVAAGRILDGPKPAVPVNSIPFSGEAAAREAVRVLVRSGADFIKVYDGVSREDYFAIIDEAKKHRIRVDGHVPTGVTALEASNAGQRSYEHLGNIIRSCSKLSPAVIDEMAKVGGTANDFSAIPARIAARTKIELASFDADRCRALYIVLARNNTWQVPTLATKRPLSLFDEGGLVPDQRLRYISPAEIENWKPENNFFLKYRTPEFIIQKKKLYRKELELVRDMHRAGVPFLTGTDIPGLYTYPGFSLHDELELFVQNGFTPFEALQAATINPARFLGMTASLGTVEKGKLADLVLLDADPTLDIRNTKRIDGVIANGVYFSRAALNDRLADAERAKTLVR